MSPSPEMPAHAETAPPGDGPDLASLLDLPTLQALLEDFQRLTGAVVAILDLRGRVLLAVGWQDVCTQFHRVHPATLRNCTESDLFLADNVQPGEYVAYPCRNGLWDVVTPLTLDGIHVGNIYTGQFFYDDQVVDLEAFGRQADHHGFDREAYLSALARVPRLSRGQVTTLMDFLVRFTGLVSAQALAAWRLRRAAAEQAEAMESLRQSQDSYRALFDGVLHGIVYQDARGVILSANSAAQRILGQSLDQMQGRTSMDPAWRSLRDDGSPFPGEEHPGMVALRTGRPVENVIMGVFNPTRGRTNWIEISSIPLFRPGEDRPFQVYTTFLDVTVRRGLEQARTFLAHAPWLVTGEDFALALARFLAGHLEMDRVRIDRLGEAPGRAEPLAVWDDGGAPDGGPYALGSTPWADALGKPLHVIPAQVGARYPEDVALRGLEAESWVGATLVNTLGQPIGLVTLMGRTPLDEARLAEATLPFVAARAAAELERRQGAAREHLREAQFRQAFGASPIGMALVALDGTFLRVNPAFCAMVGWQEADLLRIGFQAITHPEDLALVADLIAGRKEAYQLDKRYVHRNGGEVWAQLNVSLVRDAQGAPLHFVSQIQDITSRRAHEQELERMNRLHDMHSQVNRALIGTASRAEFLQAICDIATRKGGFRLAWIGWVDPETREIIPVARSGEAVGYLEGLSLTIDDVPAGQGPTGRCIRENRRYVCQDFALDPRLAPWHARAEAHGLRASVAIPICLDHRPCGALMVYSSEAGVFREREVALLEEAADNISYGLDHLELDAAHRRAEEARQETEARHRAMLQTALDGVCLIDGQGCILEANEAACRMYGYTREELLALRIPDVEALASEAVNRRHRRRVSTPTSDLFETTHLRKDGSRFPVEVSVTRLPDLQQSVAFIRDITDRRLAEDALRESRETLNLVLDTVPQSVFWKDLEGRYLGCNRVFAMAAGMHEPSEIVGRTDYDLPWSPEETEAYRADDREVIRSNRPKFHIIEPLRQADGTRIWIDTSKTPLRDTEGRPFGVLGVYEDITLRKQAEELREQSEARFRSWFQLPIIGIAITSPAKGWLEANDHLCHMLGYSREELTAMTWADLTHPEDLAADEAQFERVMRGETEGYTLEKRFIRKDGGILQTDLSVRCARRPDGTVDHFVGLLQDIGRRKAAEEALREQEELLRLSLQGADLGTWDWDIPSGDVSVNDRWFEMLGHRPGDIESHMSQWETRVHPEDLPRVQALVQAHLQGETLAYESEHRLRHRSGDWVWILDRGRVLQRAADGEPLRMCGTHLDITARKRAEAQQRQLQAQFQQAQKMDSLGSLAGGVAHDMNNVLGAILGLASAHIFTLPETSPAHRGLETIITACNRGGKLVKSLLSFARQSPAEEREVDVNAILGEEVHLLERTTLARVRLELDLAPDLRPIRGDASALTHAFMNLCVNAVDAMPEGGTLRLRTRNVDTEGILVQVQDTGTGMPREILEKAMDPFFTTKEPGKGTGLGLSLVYSTVKAHQGWMDIQSEPGRGTTVSLHFPACLPVPLAAEPGAATFQEASSGTLSVLLVDDDDLIRSSLQAMLEVLGHAVIAVPSGEAAIATLDAGFPADAVILDMNMPGLGGAGALPRIRQRHPALPVLLATGRANRTALDLVENHPHVTLLSKPFSLDELRQQLDPIAAARPPGPPVQPDPAPRHPSAAEPRNLRLLMVEDDELLGRVVADLLRRSGHAVEVVPDGAQALARLKADPPLDVAILDVNLRDTSGLEIHRRLRTFLPDLPVLMTTGLATATVEDLVAGDPRTLLVTKPYAPEDLEAACRDLGRMTPAGNPQEGTRIMDGGRVERKEPAG